MFSSLCVSSLFIDRVHFISEKSQAADGVTASYDALLELFECTGNFLKRLHIYTGISLDPLMTDIVAKIMVELISILALAKKQINRGRLSKQRLSIIKATTSERFAEQFAKRLLGDSEIETILKRLDRLTQEEARMTVAQTLAVVHGLLNNMKVVRDGESSCLVNSKRLIRLFVCVGGEASTSAIRQTLGTFLPLCANRYSLALCGMLVTMQEVANEVNKMKRASSRPLLAPWRVNRSLRRPVTEGCQKLDLSSGPV